MKTLTEIKRNVARKITIKDIISGTYQTPAKTSPFLETLWGLKVLKVNIIATIIDNYVSDDEKYATITLDDGTGVIRSKAFQNTRLIADIKAGEIIQFIGWIRNYNDELYLVPEIIQIIEDYNKIALMKLEANTFKTNFLKETKSEKTDEPKETQSTPNITENSQTKTEKPKQTDQINNSAEPKKELDENEIRQLVIDSIEKLDDGEGVDYTDILKNVKLELHLVEKAIDELLSEGSCYEPRAGKLKVL